MWMIYHEKSEFWHREFNITENVLWWITKIAYMYVKIALEQCWQKGFNVNS